MGADQSNASGGASSRGWSGSSYSSSDAGTSMSPPQIMRRMSQGAGATFPSLKLGETLASQNPSSSQPSYDEPPSPTSMSGDLGSGDFAKLRAAAAAKTSGNMNQKASLPTYDIPQPTATLDEFAPGDHRSRSAHQAHVTHLTHPWHKPTFEGSSAQGQGSAFSRSPPLTKNVASFSKQVLGMADDNAISKSSSSSSSQQPFMSSTLAPSAAATTTSSPLPSVSTRLQQRRMSTGSMMPPKEGPFDASPDDLHREWRLASRAHSYSGSSRTADRDAAADAAPSRRPRAASLSAEGLPDARRATAAASTRSPSPSSESVFAAADKFAGGFPW